MTRPADHPEWLDRLGAIDRPHADAMLQYWVGAASGKALDAPTGALIDLALAASPTTADHDEIRRCVGVARSEGVSDAEIVEATALAAILGMHSAMLAHPLLEEALHERGESAGPRTVEEQEALQLLVGDGRFWRQFDDRFGPFLTAVLRHDRQLFERFLDLTGMSWRAGAIEPKVKELIYVAVDVSTTHLYGSGASLHLRMALDLGATVDEVCEVIARATRVGFRAMPIVLDALAEPVAHGKPQA